MNEEVWNKMARYCAPAERCKADVLGKLMGQGLSPAETGEILRRLEAERFLDEARYWGGYVNDKVRFAKWGRLKIRQRLRWKKIPDALIEQALNNLDPELYRSVLRELLSGKQKGVKAANEFDRCVKLTRFALSRGFEYDEIKDALAAEGLPYG